MKFIHLLVCSIFSFFILYGPQPILPLLAASYSLNESQAGLIMTVTMLPLAIAPLAYGYLLLKVNSITLLKVAISGLAVTCVILPMAQSFEQLIAIRFCQGLLLPAALTAMTSYIGQHYRYNYLSKAITAYILSTIAGGFLGRVVSATVSEYTQWQTYFYSLSLILLCLALSLHSKKTRDYAKQSNLPVSLKENVSRIFKGNTLQIYAAVFGMFFCFTALLNYLPFILKNDYGFTSSKDIGLVYSGYLIGAVFSLFSTKLQHFFKGKVNLLLITFCVYALSISSLFTPSFWLFFIGFTLFCGAMFVIHASASALLNQISAAPSSLTNGLYVSFYYSGGTLGSFLPGVIYQWYGKSAFLGTLLVICVVSGLLVYTFRQLQINQG